MKNKSTLKDDIMFIASNVFYILLCLLAIGMGIFTYIATKQNGNPKLIGVLFMGIPSVVLILIETKKIVDFSKAKKKLKAELMKKYAEENKVEETSEEVVEVPEVSEIEEVAEIEETAELETKE